MELKRVRQRPALFNEVVVEALPCGLFWGEGGEAPFPPRTCAWEAGPGVSSPGWVCLGAPGHGRQTAH